VHALAAGRPLAPRAAGLDDGLGPGGALRVLDVVQVDAHQAVARQEREAQAVEAAAMRADQLGGLLERHEVLAVKLVALLDLRLRLGGHAVAGLAQRPAPQLAGGGVVGHLRRLLLAWLHNEAPDQPLAPVGQFCGEWGPLPCLRDC